MNKKLMTVPAALLILANNGGCGDAGSPSDARQRQATRAMTDQADRAVGMPAITNFYERRLMRDVYERRDRANLATFAYTQGLDGRLVCLGRSIGYGIPYGAQMTNPLRPMGGFGSDNSEYREASTIPQPEPNGLFMPDGAAATWIQIVNPENGHAEVVYAEPTLVVSPFRLRGAAVAVDCPA